MTSATFIAVLIASTLDQSPPAATQPAAATPPLLSGPDAAEPGDGKPTLITRTFDGKVESVGPQPDAVAIAMLDLTAEQKAKFAEIDSARKTAFDQIVRNNYGLMLELATLQAEQSATRRGDILQNVTKAFKPYTDRGSFYQEMWPHLSDDQRTQAQAMVKEYRDARLASLRSEMAGQVPAAVAAAERVEAFGQMVRESIERQIGLERDQFEEIATQLALTIEQRNAAEAIFQPIAIKRFQNIEVTKEEGAAAFAEFYRLLNAGQKQKVLGIYLRQFQQPAATKPDEKTTEGAKPQAYRSDAGPHGVSERLLTFTDDARDRDVPVKMYLPKDVDGPQPVIVFSPGWGGSRDGYALYGRHWASHGFACMVLEHDGSDTDFVREAVGETRVGAALKVAAAMRESVNDEANWINRALDVTFALDELNRRNALTGDELFGKFDLSRVGMAGHSFGAYTTMLIMGAVIDVKGETDRGFRDSRCIAGIAMSSQGEGRIGLDPKSWDNVAAPMLYLTGTKDAEMGSRDVSGRRVAFDRTPVATADDQMLITIKDAEHNAFSDNPRGFGGEAFQRNPAHHQWILMTTTAFWDANLRDDTKAKAWLAGDAIASISKGDCAVERK